MNVTLWIIAAVLALVFFATGIMKLTQPRAKLAGAGMEWTATSSDGRVKTLGALEVAAAIGLIVPAITGIAPALVPVAATCLAVVMAGAAVLHFRRDENQMIAVNVTLLAVAIVVAWGRFGPYPF